VGHSGEVTAYCFSIHVLIPSIGSELYKLCILQRVYLYFRGSGKEAEMRREAARGAARAAF